jgi:NAD(P)-dependent dehydrogenase (short-subunit alcohol dehydrogenase family)
MLLENRVALVTGSSRGIGAAIVKGFAREGCRVIVNYNKSKKAGEEVFEEVKKSSNDSMLLGFDVSQKDQVDSAVNKIIDRYGRIDILVNNAGIVLSSSFLDIKEKDLDRLININFKGSLYCAQAAAKSMIDNKYGKIINMTSISGFSPFFDSAHYAMTKAGLAMMTKNMALELGKHNIMVNSLIPGIIKTEIVRGYDDEELMKRMNRIIPLDRIGYPEDMVGAAIFLASPLSDYVSGIAVLVDGGFSLFKDKNPEK